MVYRFIDDISSAQIFGHSSAIEIRLLAPKNVQNPDFIVKHFVFAFTTGYLNTNVSYFVFVAIE